MDDDAEVTFPQNETSPSHSSDARDGNNVLELLRALAISTFNSQDQPKSDERECLLKALYALCISSPGVVDLCISEGVIETVLRMLNSHPHSQSSASDDMATWMMENEKAIALLQVLTSSSRDSLTATLNQSSLLITTLGKILLRVSETCTDLVITILTMLCRHPSAAALAFCQAVSGTAIPSKLVIVLQVSSNDTTKQKAGTLLRVLGQRNKKLEQP
ncbi:hypothetical protein KP509_27G058700 [Ceratopteris richardii]|nr:hypothetical protein KP509_27G058700 [Ceratopteris richardii]